MSRLRGELKKIEFIVLFVALPLVMWRMALAGTRVMVLPVLWFAAVFATWWLIRKRGWTWKKFFGLERVTRKDWSRMGLRVGVGAVLLCVAFYVVTQWDTTLFPSAGDKASAWFGFARKKPLIWLAVMVLYPLLSVLPQGVVYRALFYERYAGLFGRFAGAVATVVFSLAHVVFNNPHALVLTLVGGAIFTWQHRNKGMMFANIEHALFGNLAFTIGWGIFLHGGTLAMMRGAG